MPRLHGGPIGDGRRLGVVADFRARRTNQDRGSAKVMGELRFCDSGAAFGLDIAKHRCRISTVYTVGIDRAVDDRVAAEQHRADGQKRTDEIGTIADCMNLR